MTQVGFSTFVPKMVDTVFIVQNVTLDTPQEKTVKVFAFPIHAGQTRDLLAIPQVSEADIRHSLLKGELKTKFICGELRVTRSNIDLLQFDNEQKEFLESVGITEGLEVMGVGDIPFVFKQEQELVGIKNSINRVFTVPAPDKFIEGSFGANEFHVLIRHNGRELVQGIDFTISESGGASTGFDTINFVSFIPKARSTLVADYVVEA